MARISGNPTTLECAHFVDAVDEWMCPICLRVVVSPLQCKEGHVFCKGCIKTALREKKKCPVDRSALQVADLSRARAVEETVSRKRLRCPCAAQHTDEEDGCGWVGMVRERQTHIDTECGYTSVPCPHDGCEVRVQRRAVEEHAASCEQRVEACEHCGEGGVVSQRAQHEQVCPQVAVECPFKEVGCTAPSMLRKDVAAHEAEAGQKHATLALAAQKEGRERARALGEAATKAEDRCNGVAVTDVWVIHDIPTELKSYDKRSYVHRVTLSQNKDEKKTVTIEAEFGGAWCFTVTGDLSYPSVSVLLYNTRGADEPLEVARSARIFDHATLRSKYLTGDGCLTLTTTLHGT